MRNVESVQLFCSDLDGTLLGHPESTKRFKRAWESIPFTQRPILCYSTGRFEEEIYDLVEQQVLPYPDYVICAVGTRLYKGNIEKEITRYREKLEQEWNREKAEQIMSEIDGVFRQPDKYQNEYKSSWHLAQDNPELVDRLERIFRARAIKVTIVYSSGRDLDILPVNAGKGKALHYLCSQLDVPLDQVLVAGNTGNDSSMFLINGVRGILVSNAMPELCRAVDAECVFQATRSIGDGVIEGLNYFGLDCSVNDETVLAEVGE